jgi:hypothetical protein
MNRIQHCAAILTGLSATLIIIVTATAPAALAVPPPARPAQTPVTVHTVITGGMPGWQITLIAVGSALAAAALALLLDRAWAVRRRPAAS